MQQYFTSAQPVQNGVTAIIFKRFTTGEWLGMGAKERGEAIHAAFAEYLRPPEPVVVMEIAL